MQLIDGNEEQKQKGKKIEVKLRMEKQTHVYQSGMYLQRTAGELDRKTHSKTDCEERRAEDTRLSAPGTEIRVTVKQLANWRHTDGETH